MSSTSNGQFNAFTALELSGCYGCWRETGATYRAHDSFHTHQVLTPDGHTVYTSEESTSLIATGNDAPSTPSVMVVHMVMQPDGTVTANVDHADSTCN